jgi:hypothetical protein
LCGVRQLITVIVAINHPILVCVRGGNTCYAIHPAREWIASECLSVASLLTKPVFVAHHIGINREAAAISATREHADHLTTIVKRGTT